MAHSGTRFGKRNSLGYFFGSGHNTEHYHVEWEMAATAIVFFVLGVWLASGSVSTTQTSITKRVLWRSLSFRWDQITEVRLHKKDGGAIELRGRSTKANCRFPIRCL